MSFSFKTETLLKGVQKAQEHLTQDSIRAFLPTRLSNHIADAFKHFQPENLSQQAHRWNEKLNYVVPSPIIDLAKYAVRQLRSDFRAMFGGGASARPGRPQHFRPPGFSSSASGGATANPHPDHQWNPRPPPYERPPTPSPSYDGPQAAPPSYEETQTPPHGGTPTPQQSSATGFASTDAGGQHDASEQQTQPPNLPPRPSGTAKSADSSTASKEHTVNDGAKQGSSEEPQWEQAPSDFGLPPEPQRADSAKSKQGSATPQESAANHGVKSDDRPETKWEEPHPDLGLPPKHQEPDAGESMHTKEGKQHDTQEPHTPSDVPRQSSGATESPDDGTTSRKNAPRDSAKTGRVAEEQEWEANHPDLGLPPRRREPNTPDSTHAETGQRRDTQKESTRPSNTRYRPSGSAESTPGSASSEEKNNSQARNAKSPGTTLPENDLGRYYEFMGVSPMATEGQIRAAYKKLALKLHPDKIAFYPDKSVTLAEIETKFKKLGEAYEILSDPSRRRSYDKTCQMAGPYLVGSMHTLYKNMCAAREGEFPTGPSIHSDSKGYYKLFGASPDASHEQIQEAIKNSSAPIYGPRVAELLGNPARRDRYDRQCIVQDVYKHIGALGTTTSEENKKLLRNVVELFLSGTDN